MNEFGSLLHVLFLCKGMKGFLYAKNRKLSDTNFPGSLPQTSLGIPKKIYIRFLGVTELVTLHLKPAKKRTKAKRSR